MAAEAKVLQLRTYGNKDQRWKARHQDWVETRFYFFATHFPPLARIGDAIFRQSLTVLAIRRILAAFTSYHLAEKVPLIGSPSVKLALSRTSVPLQTAPKTLASLVSVFSTESDP